MKYDHSGLTSKDFEQVFSDRPNLDPIQKARFRDFLFQGSRTGECSLTEKKDMYDHMDL